MLQPSAGSPLNLDTGFTQSVRRHSRAVDPIQASPFFFGQQDQPEVFNNIIGDFVVTRPFVEKFDRLAGKVSQWRNMFNEDLLAPFMGDLSHKEAST